MIWYGYGSIPINIILRGMNIHLTAILMFTRGTRFWHPAISPIRFLEHPIDPFPTISPPHDGSCTLWVATHHEAVPRAGGKPSSPAVLLTRWWLTYPSEKIWKSVGMMTFPIYIYNIWKKKQMFQTINQLRIVKGIGRDFCEDLISIRSNISNYVFVWDLWDLQPSKIRGYQWYMMVDWW